MSGLEGTPQARRRHSAASAALRGGDFARRLIMAIAKKFAIAEDPEGQDLALKAAMALDELLDYAKSKVCS